MAPSTLASFLYNVCHRLKLSFRSKESQRSFGTDLRFDVVLKRIVVMPGQAFDLAFSGGPPRFNDRTFFDYVSSSPQVASNSACSKLVPVLNPGFSEADTSSPAFYFCVCVLRGSPRVLCFTGRAKGHQVLGIPRTLMLVMFKINPLRPSIQHLQVFQAHPDPFGSVSK